MTKDDLVYVGHMLDAACEIRGIVAVKSRAEFDSDRVLRLALTHLIQTVGEAAGRVSPAFAEAHATVPWAVIVGMRHKLVHGYVEVDEDVVWQTAAQDVPRLIEMLEPLLTPE